MNIPENPRTIPPKVLEAAEEYLKQCCKYKIVGLVLRDHDTANVEIISHETLSDDSKVQNRMLVVPEFTELMEPTNPCVQLGLQRLVKQIQNANRWKFESERSSGLDGYRCRDCGIWVHASSPRKCICD